MGQSRIDRDRVRNVDGTVDTLEEAIAYLKFHEDNTEGQESRKDDSKLVYDYYWGVRQADLLKDVLKQKFPNTWSDRLIQTENTTRAIIEAMSVVYKSRPNRAVRLEDAEVSEAEQDSFKAIRDVIQSTYDSMVEDSGLDFQMQKMERYNNFDHTTLMQIGYLEGANRMAVEVYPQFLFDVILDSEGMLKTVILSDFFGDEDQEEHRTYQVWTEDNFWKLDNKFSIISNGINDENANPYGILPFVLIRRFTPDIGFYCDPALELQRVNQNINYLLTSAIYLSDFQVHGQLVTQNMAFPAGTKMGPETILNGEPVNPDAAMDIKFLSPGADFDAVLGLTERLLIGFTNSMGLPSNMFSVSKTGGTASGVALKIASAPLMEFRESQEERFRVVEAEILKVMVQIWNLNTANHGMDELPEDLNVTITYDKPSSAFDTPAQETQTMLLLLAQGLIKPTDIVIKNNPSFSLADAKRYLEEVSQEKTEFLGMGAASLPAESENSVQRNRSAEIFRNVTGINNAVQSGGSGETSESA